MGLKEATQGEKVVSACLLVGCGVCVFKKKKSKKKKIGDGEDGNSKSQILPLEKSGKRKTKC